MRLLIAVLTPLLVWVGSLRAANRAAGPPPTAAVEIQALLNDVSVSTLSFVRNGTAYDGRRAADHLRKKFEHYRPEITSAEDFIRLAATKSELSGRPYLIRDAPGHDVRCDAWLTGRLRELRAGAPSKTKEKSR